jgi:uncharacterized protein (DUF433 family)
MVMELSERIVVDPEILAGKPVVRGTRLAVEFILELLAAGQSENNLLNDYPGLTREDILACLSYASTWRTSTRPIQFLYRCVSSPTRTSQCRWSRRFERTAMMSCGLEPIAPDGKMLRYWIWPNPKRAPY